MEIYGTVGLATDDRIIGACVVHAG